MQKAKKYIHRHKNGSLWGKGSLIGEAMHGYWEWFRKDGTLMRSGNFDHGKQTGQWITYDKHGKVVKKTSFDKKPPIQNEGKSVDVYISAFPKDVQKVLEKIRHTIRKSAPTATESISYRMPAYKLRGKPLVYFAAFTEHIGMYPPAPKEFKKETEKYAGPKGNLKFSLDEPIPFDLIRKIVQFKVKLFEQAVKK